MVLGMVWGAPHTIPMHEYPIFLEKNLIVLHPGALHQPAVFTFWEILAPRQDAILGSKDHSDDK
jgi:hypothetical protein